MRQEKRLREQLRPLWPYVRPHVALAIGLIVFATIQVGANLVVARSMGWALDAGLASDLSQFKTAVLWIIIAWTVLDITFYFRLIVNGALGERVCHGIRAAASRHLSVAKQAELYSVHSGDYVSRLSNDLTQIRSLMATELQFFIRSPIQFVLTLGYMLLLSWKITLISLCLLPILMYLTGLVSRPISGHAQEAQAEMANINGLAQDAANGVVVTKVFNIYTVLARRFREAGTKQANAQINLTATQGRLTAVAFLLNMGPLLVLFGLGGYEVISGRLTLGSLIILLNLLGNLAWPLQSVAQSFGKVKAAAASVERIFAIFALPIENVTTRDGVFSPSEYAIEMEDIGFSYDSHKPVFTGLNLKISNGETVAIVGHSGTGKTTLLSLLLGLVEPECGTIKIYGQPLSTGNLYQVRSMLAYVPQDSTLFAKTVKENIRLGKPNASDTEIEMVARQAFAHEFIQSLPAGYDTVLGEDGVGLSGGQKQRLSISRAMLRDAPILLLDEATSALDTESEARIKDALDSLRAGRTMIIVAHRLSTIRGADRIIVVDKGRVVEEGSHNTLINKGGLYSTLYRHQFSDASQPAIAGA